MAKALDDNVGDRTAAERSNSIDWRKGMSDNVALALLVYTALQIFVTVQALKQGLPDILPYIALVVLVAGIIPACRWFERRWSGLTEEEAHDAALRGAYRRDQLALWVLAICLPLILTGLAKLAWG
jgi:protein-S-isoprenylcysteine O-methyltransferase Ste14